MAKLVQLTNPNTDENIFPRTPTKAIINTDGSNLSAVNGIVKGDGNGNFIAVTITPDTIGAATKPVAKTVVLSVSSWSDNTATIAVTGMTTNSNIIIAAAPVNHMAYAQAGVRCSAQGSGTLTFVCENTPTEDLTVNVLIVG